ncbi:MAG TPA: acetate kinase [Ktedonobacteraceae bacterium]|jgi:acetate kinase
MKILVLNAGSSSQKLRLYEIARQTPPALTPPAPLWAVDADWGEKAGQITITHSAGGETSSSQQPAGERTEILRTLLESLWQGKHAVLHKPGEIDLIGHRVVHGGHHSQHSALITPPLLEALYQLVPFAPLHQSANLAGIETTRSLFPAQPQVAVFDTAYHRQMPRVARIYPGPYAWFEQGICRYGFHGISHAYCAQRSAQLVGQEISLLRIVTCHLGNGCSLAAILGGQSIDTTMGFTPLEGLMMGTRSGSLDPEILLYLQREQGTSHEELADILNHQSGLKGISGISGDMRTILEARTQGNERAILALDLYIYRLRSCLGSMIAALEGIDVLTFTGGVGEHSSEVRARTCKSFGFLGIALDEEKNAAAAGDQDISAENASVRVLVVHTEEDWEIARTCWQRHA